MNYLVCNCNSLFFTKPKIVGKIDLDWGGETKSKKHISLPLSPHSLLHTAGGRLLSRARREERLSEPLTGVPRRYNPRVGGKGLLAIIATSLRVLLDHFSDAESGV